jgi:uncharacterized membrane protein YqiK
MIFIIPGFKLVRDDEVGLLTRKMFGKPLPEGHIIATEESIVGVMAKTLMPGLYWRFPLIWTIEKADVTQIKPNNIGLVESVDGVPIPAGRLLGDQVDCDDFQDASAFLKNGGHKGVQVRILNPGTYRINTKVFKITETKATEIAKE